jgi:uncharacterized membrane protein
MIPWDKLHGAITHFPIALLLFSTACDFVSITLKKLPFARELRSISLYALAIAALAALGGVISALLLAKVICGAVEILAGITDSSGLRSDFWWLWPCGDLS